MSTTWRTATFDEIVQTFAPHHAVEAVAFAENLGPYPVVKVDGVWYDAALPGNPLCVMPESHATAFDHTQSGDLRP